MNDWNSERVKALRTKKGWRQQDLAVHLGTFQQVVSQWERGLFKPNAHFRELMEEME